MTKKSLHYLATTFIIFLFPISLISVNNITNNNPGSVRDSVDLETPAERVEDTLPPDSDDEPLEVIEVEEDDMLVEEEIEAMEQIAREAYDAEQSYSTSSFDFDDVVLRVENKDYYYLRDGLNYNDDNFLFFRVTHDRAVAEIRIFPEIPGQPIKDLGIIPSADFEIMDSLIFLENEYHRTRVRFDNLRQTDYPTIILSFRNVDGNRVNREIKLFPFFVSSIIYDREPIELFREEEKAIELPAQNAFNINTPGEWESHGDFEYRLTRSGSNIRIIVKALATGEHVLPLVPATTRPWINDKGEIVNRADTVNLRFSVKPSRMPFVNIDQDYIFYDEGRRRAVDIRMDYLSGLQLGESYRIENRQEPGGTLIAELQPRSYTSDNKMLATIRPYDHHRTSDGYLYINDGQRTLGMTNFNIINRPEISNIEIMREGQDWTSSLNVYPGENLEIKVEGRGLLDVDIKFDGCRQQIDSVRKSDRVKFFNLEVPVDISRRQIMIFLNNEITRHELRVREYQTPADFDFVVIDYGENNIRLNDNYLNKPVFYPETIKDINIAFDPSKIDSDGDLNGKQYISLEVRILDENNKLLDLQNISNIVVCPDESSPRHAFYQREDCRQQVIRLNDHLLRNTYLLDAFSQIIITVKHNENKYDTPVQERRINIFVERRRSFDIMVSFPTGLLVKEFRESGIGNLSGISTSVLAELSFYDPQRIGKKKPYKIGAGFIALNAFNFRDSGDIQRDIGLVVIGSIEPVRSDAKFSFPIYLGMGYLLDQGDMFAIFGPGIRLQF